MLSFLCSLYFYCTLSEMTTIKMINRYSNSLTHTCMCHLAPVPLSIFRSNSKFDENSKHSSVKYTRPITTIFWTRHDSDTVVTCAKYRCDRLRIFYTRVFWIFLVGRAPGLAQIISHVSNWSIDAMMWVSCSFTDNFKFKFKAILIFQKWRGVSLMCQQIMV